MSTLQDFAAAGYQPFPAMNGHAIVGGMVSGHYRYTPGSANQFPGCDVGLLCAGRVMSGASGAGSLAAVSSTWIAAIRWVSHNPAVRKEIAAIVNAALGAGPAYIDGETATRLVRIEQQFASRKLAPMHFSGEAWQSLSYVPHQFEIICRGGMVILGPGAKPTPRAELALINEVQAGQIITDVETAFIKRGALPWR